MRLNRSARFKRSFKKLPTHIQDDFGARIRIFIDDPFAPSLRTHKLSGALADYYAFYLRDGYRALFDFTENGDVLLINIGNLAEGTRLNRQNLYKALSDEGNPRLETVGSILHALGFRLSVERLAKHAS